MRLYFVVRPQSSSSRIVGPIHKTILIVVALIVNGMCASVIIYVVRFMLLSKKSALTAAKSASVMKAGAVIN